VLRTQHGKQQLALWSMPFFWWCQSLGNNNKSCVRLL
jgi:hypothetical protein